MTVTILDPRTGRRVAISVPDKGKVKQRARLRILRELGVGDDAGKVLQRPPGKDKKFGLRAFRAETATTVSARLAKARV
jgi:hypothetical protein